MLVNSVGIARNQVQVPYGLTPAGLLFFWGLNSSAQLGQGDFISRSSPVQVGTSSWAQVANGSFHTLALNSNGTLWAWGNNTLGELGTSLFGSTRSWTAVAGGTGHMLAIRSDGTLWSWGNNTAGQLGTNDLVHRSSPVQIGTSSIWASVTAGGSFSVALRNDGSLWTWGLGTNGRLGSGATASRSSPVQVGTSSWSQIAAGTDHAFGITSTGELWGWGNSNSNQLGRSFFRSWRMVSTGNFHSVGIDSNFNMWAWGSNTFGEIGDSSLNVHRSAPMQIGSGTSWIYCAAGQYHSAAIRTDGRLATWGNGANGALGDGTTSARPAVTILSGNTTSFVMVKAGNNNIYCITNTGTLWTSGFNNAGQLGLGSTTNQTSLVSHAGTWADVTPGSNWALFLDTSGRIYSTGNNWNGRLGLSDVDVHRSSKTQIGTATDWSKIGAAGGSGYAIKTNGTLWGWGVYSGNGSTTNSPVQIGTDTNWVETGKFGGLGNTSFARKSDGTAWVWGDNSNGELALNHRTTQNTPVQLPFSAGNCATGGVMNAFVMQDNAFGREGALAMAGSNGSGQVGDNTVTARSSPVFLGAATETSSPLRSTNGGSWTSVSAGDSFSMAIRNDGSLWATGKNGGGTIGDNTNASKTSFIQIGTMSWSAVSAGRNHTLAVRTDGTLWAWGINATGELGDGTTTHRSSPVQIGLGTDWSMKVKAGPSYSQAIKNDGSLWVWGQNTAGSLGTNNILHRSSPVQLGSISWTNLASGLMQDVETAAAITSDNLLYTWGNMGALGSGGQNVTNATSGHRSSPVVIGNLPTLTADVPVQIGTKSWKKIAASDRSSFGIDLTDKLFAWGDNANGQLGQNNQIHRSSPVQITGGADWSQIKAGTGFAAGIRTNGSIWSWGINNLAQLGIGDRQSRSSPVQVAANKTWKSLGLGGSHAAAIDSNDQIWAWGNNSNGAVGPAFTESFSWTTIATARNGAGTSNQTLAIRQDGLLFGWGVNTSGQLGLGDLAHRSSPVQIGTSSWTAVSTSSIGHTLGVDAIGRLFAWGLNDSGQLGVNDLVHRSSPVLVSASRSFSQVAAGHRFSAAIDNLGLLWIWGQNTNGQLGTGNVVHRSSPVQVPGSWSSISAASSFITAIKSDGTLWAWGSNSTQALGNIYTPTLSFNQIAAGPFSTYAISNGTIFGSGDNQWGELGLSDTVHRSSPVQIGSAPASDGDSWVQVVANYRADGATVLARRKGTTGIFAWGRNTTAAGIPLHGQWNPLSQTGGQHRSAPVQVFPGSYTQIAINDTLAAAVRSDGLLFAWGSNNNYLAGQGEGSAEALIISSPTQIGSQSWKQIAIGGSHVMAIDNQNQLYGWGSNQSGQLGFSNNNTIYSWSQLSGGLTSSFAIRSDGKLFAWGPNTNGNLGLGDVNFRSSPVQVGTSSWTSVFASEQHTLAIRADGTLWAWGSNTDGKAGLYSAASSWTQVYAGQDYTLAVKPDGTLWSWGTNALGQLGLNDIAHRSSPVQVQAGLSNWSYINAGTNTVMTVRSDKSLWAWGNNANGQLGDNSQSHRSSPVQVGGSWSMAVATAAGTVGIKIDGTLWTWGLGRGAADANAPRLGDGSYIHRSSPVQIAAGTSWMSVAAGTNHFLALDNNNRLYGWGRNDVGQIGINSSLSSWTQVSQGTNHTLAIRDDGMLFGWGNNANGQVTALTATQSWSKIAATNFILAVRSDGTLWSWGDNINGQLGLNDTVHRSSPVQIGVANDWQDVAAGLSGIALAIKNNGTLWSWGNNANGGLGSSTTAHRSSPVQVGSNTYWSQVYSNPNGAHVAALDTLGRLWAWGLNTAGQLGTNDIISRSSPVQVAGSWSQVSIGGSHTLAMRSSDSLIFAWGNNASGQLGDNTVAHRSSPVQIGANAYSKIGAGGTYSVGIRTNSTLWGWGGNTNGELGQGDIVSRSSPVQIGTDSDWANLFPGALTVAVVKNNNTLWAWGFSTNGELGVGSAAHRSRPMQIGIDRSWTTSSIVKHLGLSHAAFVDSTNVLYQTGGNAQGQLGQGDVANRSSPVQIGATLIPAVSSPTQIGTSSWSQVAAGDSYSLAIRADGTMWGWGSNTSGRAGVFNPAPYYRAISGDNNTIQAITKDGRLFTTGYGNLGTSGTNDSLIYRSSFTQIGTESFWKNVRVGSGNVVALRNDNTLWTWGANAVGQLGDNTTAHRSSPVQIGNSVWSSISAGNSNAMAIKADGTLWVWGNNNDGILGLNDTAHRSSPVQLGGSWNMISNGRLGTHTLGIKADGTLWAWGTNASFELGLNSPTIHYTQKSFTAMSSGGTHFAGIDNLGKLWVWGANGNGQLGDNTVTAKLSMIQIGTSSWAQVATSSSNTYAIRSDSTLWAWGQNNYGQLGLNDLVHRSSPVQVGTSSWTSISAHSGGFTAVRLDGTLWTAGRNDLGQLGMNDLVHRSSPVQIGTGNTWSKVFSTDGNVRALTTTGILYAWGNNNTGCLGDNSSIHRSSPVQIGSDSWAKVVGLNDGNFSAEPTLGIKTDGTLWAWGNNNFGRLGLNDTIHRSSPVQVGSDSNWIDVVAGSQSYGIKSDGSMWALGGTQAEENGPGTVNRSSPVQVGAGLTWTRLTHLYLFNSVFFAQDSTGQLYFWANSNSVNGVSTTAGNGQLDVVPRKITKHFVVQPVSSPVQIGSGSSWIFASAGKQFSYAIRTDGTLWAWGSTRLGQLGDDNNFDVTGEYRSSMVQIGSGYWSEIRQGSLAAIARRSDNTVWAWGYNVPGQLGQGDRIHRSSPVQIGSGTYQAIESNGDNNYLIDTNNVLYGIGYGNIGQLGRNNGTGVSSPVLVVADTLTASASSPVQVGSVDSIRYSWTQVAAGTSRSLAVRSDNTLWTWGSNTLGELGDSTLLSRSSPVQIGASVSTSSWTQVVAGGTHSLARRADGALFVWGQNSLGQAGFSAINQIGQSWKTGQAWFNSSDRNLAIRSDGSLWVIGGTSTLGDGSANANRSSPVQIGTSFSWNVVGTGDGYYLAIDSLGRLYGWGTNAIGELGLNDVTARLNFTTVGTGFSWTTVAAADGKQSLAIRTNGTLWAWGQNTSGQLGLNDVANRSSPVQVGTSSWTSVTAGGQAGLTALSAAIRTDGTLWAWGNNSLGQLGQNNTINRSSPVQIGAGFSWAKVSAGVSAFVMAIRTDGTLWAWGNNANGQLGDGTIIHRSSPVQIGTSSWTMISTGLAWTHGITVDGRLFAWGLNTWGNVGDNTIINRSSPVQVAGSWSGVSSGGRGTLAVGIDGLLYSWGRNDVGQIGSNNQIHRSSPVLVGNGVTTIVSPIQLGTESWAMVAAGASHSVGVRSDNTLWTWGANPGGQLGTGNLVHRSALTQIMSGTSWVSVAAGQNQTYAITSVGTVWSTGLNTNGALGQADQIHRSTPVIINSLVGNPVSNVYAGDLGNTMMVRRSDGIILAAGTGSIGDLSAQHRSRPVQIGGNPIHYISTPTLIGSDSWTMIDAGANHSVGLKADGTLWTWGSNSNGQIGDGTQIDTLSNFNQVSGSWAHVHATDEGNGTLAIKTDGTLWTWGNNSAGQLGDGTILTRLSPVQVGSAIGILPGVSYVDIGSGQSHTLALRSDGMLVAFGQNANGQLASVTDVIARSSPLVVGRTYLAATSSPVQISALGSWVSASSLGSFSVARRADGSLWAWGNNANGQLGQNDLVHRSNPVQIGTSSWVSASAGAGHVIAVTSIGGLFAWGLNSVGQIGDNTIINRSSPVQIGTSSWSTVSAGASHSMALNTSSLLWSWGSNTHGQIGDGTNAHRSSPVQIGSTSWAQISTGWSHNVAVDTAGKLYIWGQNNYGQLGQNDLIHRSSPVQVGTDSWSTAFAAGAHTLGIRDDNRLFVWGNNSNGNIGDNDASGHRSSPVLIGGNTKTTFTDITKSGNESWIVISSGTNFTLGIKPDYTLWSWGNNNIGQLGLNDLVHRSSPVQIGTSSWTSVTAGNSHVVGLTVDGNMFAWGNNASSQLGDNTTAHRSSPTQIGAGSSWVGVNTNISHTTALRSDGRWFVWGGNNKGQLGQVDIVNKVIPTAVNGRWMTATSSPVQIGAYYLDSAQIFQSWNWISTNDTHSAAIRSDGTLWTWGSTTTGALGDNTIVAKSSPVQIGTSSWLRVGAGLSHTLAVKADGTLWAWGGNADGRLGDNTVLSRSSPVQIGTSSWTNIESGGVNSFGTTSDGRLFAWGAGNNGANADITINIHRSSPVQVGGQYAITAEFPIRIGTSSWLVVHAGTEATAAIRADNTLWTWGLNNLGQLGLNDLVHRSSPVQVGTSSWTGVVAGVSTMMAVRSDGTLWTWGSNTDGRLGDITAAHRSSPVQIGAAASWVLSSSGSNAHNSVIKY